MDKSDAAQALFEKSISSYDAPLTPKLFFDGGCDYEFGTRKDNVLTHNSSESPVGNMVDPLSIEIEHGPILSEATALRLPLPATSTPEKTVSVSTITLQSETRTAREAQPAIFNKGEISLPSVLDPKTQIASSWTIPIIQTEEPSMQMVRRSCCL